MLPIFASAQRLWVNVDSLYAPLPSSVHVYRSTDSLDGKAFIGYYVEAKLKDRSLEFTTDTTKNRRITPTGFYKKDESPLVVVNGTFFSYETNRSLNLVIKDNKIVSDNNERVKSSGKDSTSYFHIFKSSIGIDKRGNADVAWCLADSGSKKAFASQYPIAAYKEIPGKEMERKFSTAFKKWKMKTAIGGGPVLVQDGKQFITNEQEHKFTGKAINDKHPRTLMGYTGDGKLIIMVIQGRFPGIAEGATLPQEAKLMAELGCIEALNLDGGGSSCMLVNGKETIKPSDKEGERAVPAVFIIKSR